MALSGNLRQVAFAEVLRGIEGGRRTGCLLIEWGTLRAGIYFADGQWLLTERHGDTAPLGHQLARAGILTPARFEMATGVPMSDAALVSDIQAVRMLISAQMLTQEQLRAWAASDAIALLAVVLSWPDGEFSFEDDAQLPSGRVAIPLAITPLLTQALGDAHRGTPPPAIRPLPPEVVVDFAPIDPQSGAPVRLSREQWRVLTMVDGNMPLWAIAEALQAPDEIILRVAAELVAAGVVVEVGRVGEPSAEEYRAR